MEEEWEEQSDTIKEDHCWHLERIDWGEWAKAAK